MKIIIGSDHAGYQAKEKIKEILTKYKYDYEDVGANSQDSIDYPDIAGKVCEKIIVNNKELTPNTRLSSDSHSQVNSHLLSESPSLFGILICGSGVGMQIAANKYQKIRAAFCYDIYGAEMARRDNNANIITLRAREFDWNKYEDIVTTFLSTSFSKEQRHIRRIEKLK